MTRLFKRTLLAAAFTFSLPAVAASSVVVDGVANITGTWSFDFDTGTQVDFTQDPGADIFWEQFTTTTRAVVTVNGAQIVNLGNVSFASLSLETLQGLSYGNTPISGNDVGNELTYGNVFAIKTNAGNYAKAIVAFPRFDNLNNNGLPIYFQTLSAVPESDTLALALGGLGVVGLIWRRRNATR